MQQLRKLQKLIIGMGEALLCYGAEISRVEETIQRVADHYQVEEVEMYVITNGLICEFASAGGLYIHTAEICTIDICKFKKIM